MYHTFVNLLVNAINYHCRHSSSFLDPRQNLQEWLFNPSKKGRKTYTKSPIISKLLFLVRPLLLFTINMGHLRVIPHPFTHVNRTRCFLSKKVDHLLSSHIYEALVVFDRIRVQSPLPHFPTTRMFLLISDAYKI